MTVAVSQPIITNHALVQQAVDALRKAASIKQDEATLLAEERSAWRPNSWLIQRCWEMLVDAGAGEEALTVAAMAQARHPLAPLHALRRIAQQIEQRPHLALLVRRELTRQSTRLFTANPDGGDFERLLLIAASAAQLGDLPLACTCLEHLDQLSKPWDRVMVRAELRALLAESVAQIGVHPLTVALVEGAVRRFDDAGAQFVHLTAAQLLQRAEPMPQRCQRLLERALATFRFAALTSLHSRRLATITFGQAGLVPEVIDQLTTIANIQDARRETGFSAHKEDPLLLRQVKRPAANAEVDFQVYTLQQAVKAMPLRALTREERITLAEQLAVSGVRSDGWTAAGAAATLIELGALKYAVDVVKQIAPNDPTRSEGMLALVRGLLTVGEPQMAEEQAKLALGWARTQRSRNPERAITWGLAQIYLEHGQPDRALQLLDLWREPTGWRQRLQTVWGKRLDDDTLRLQGLRLRSLLQRGPGADLRAYNQEIRRLFSELRAWAPRLLEGEALVNFYLDHLFRPLLAASQLPQAWELLAELVRILNSTSGDKHANHVAEIARQLRHQYLLATVSTASPHGAPAPAHPLTGKTAPPPPELSEPLRQFLTTLWQTSAQRGSWQVVHSLEGSLPLLLTLEGPLALVALASAVAGGEGRGAR